MKKIPNPFGQLGDYSEYLLLDYRRKLLRIPLAMCIAIAIGETILNLIEWLRAPAIEWGSFNLLTDVIALVIFPLLYWANRKGFVAFSGWSFGLILLSAIPTSYSIHSINQSFLIMALPIVLSSFVILPWASFVFVCIVIIFYNVEFLHYPGAFEYDIFGLMTLLFMAVSSYLVSNVLNKAISDTVHAYDETIQGWAKALEMRDSETMGHSQRIVELTLIALFRTFETR